jgi:DNA-binding IclR family transcriptional regulator
VTLLGDSHVKPQTETDKELETTGDAKDSSRFSTRTLERGLAILDCYDMDHWGWTLTDICKQTGLPKATAFRLLKTLESRRYLTLDPPTGRYCLGASMVKAAYLMLSHSEISRTARPFLETLAEATTETAVLAAWVAERSLTLDVVLTTRPFRPFIQVGQMLNDLRNAHTQVFLAFQPDAERDAIISALREALGDTAAFEPRVLEERLAEVRVRGVAYDLGERTKGICAAAAPVHDASGQVRTTLGVIAPTERFMADMVKYEVPLKEAAHALSRELGYREAADMTESQQ